MLTGVWLNGGFSAKNPRLRKAAKRCMQVEKMKYWQKLLIKKREMGEKGLTIPFLIGSQKYFTDTIHKQTINDLFIDILGDETFETNLRYCMDKKVFLLEKRSNNNAIFFPFFKSKHQKKLSVQKYSYNDPDFETVEKIIIKMENDFNDKIKNSKFSVDVNEFYEIIWDDFSQKDIDFIKNALSTLN